MAFMLPAAFRSRHFHSLLGNIVIAFFNVLSFALLVRLLPKSAFGEWVLFIASYNILDQVRTGLMQTSIIKFYAGSSEEDGKRVAGAGWLISGILTLGYVALCFLIFLIAGPWLNATWHFFICWLGILTLFSLPMNFASWMLQATHRFDKIVLIRLSQNGTFLILLGILYLLHMVTLPNVLLAYTSSMAVSSIYCLLRKWTYLHTFAFRTREQAVALYRYGRLIVGSMASSTGQSYADNIVLRYLLGPEAVALYSIPQKFMEVVEIILRSFVATAQPTLSESANRQDLPAVARAFCRYTGTVSILIFPFILGMLLLTEPLIRILASGSYLAATDIVRIILLSAICWPMDRFIGVTLDMMNLPHINFNKNILKFALSVTLEITLILLFKDIRSVAIASFCTVIFAIIYGYYFIRKHLQIQMRDIWHYGWQECRTLLQKAGRKKPVVLND
ncbi:lipopolysaccharide biosynthesis protein [Chitinophaga solisilvae]|uniref:lipopolysaccharide biosynthesis protein n=1 Tax=Chitinophaga solisilvae TaxID=1233460 RepID=UPI001367D8A0|nr:oligosaccharide flippase family protein [Chitinophaga solisilvae]